MAPPKTVPRASCHLPANRPSLRRNTARFRTQLWSSVCYQKDLFFCLRLLLTTVLYSRVPFWNRPSRTPVGLAPAIVEHCPVPVELPMKATSTHQLQWNQAPMAAAALWLGNGESGKPGHFHVGPSPGQPRWCDSLQCWVSAALGVWRVWTHMLFFTVALATRGCGRSVFNSCLCLTEAHLICLRSWGLVWQSFSLPHGCEIVLHKHSPPAGLEADCPFWGVTWDLSYIILSLIHVHCNILSLWHVHRSPEGISQICEFGDIHFPEPLTWMPKPLRSTGTKIFNSFLFLLLPTVMPLPESPLSKLSKFHS